MMTQLSEYSGVCQKLEQVSVFSSSWKEHNLTPDEKYSDAVYAARTSLQLIRNLARATFTCDGVITITITNARFPVAD